MVNTEIVIRKIENYNNYKKIYFYYIVYDSVYSYFYRLRKDKIKRLI